MWLMMLVTPVHLVNYSYLYDVPDGHIFPRDAHVTPLTKLGELGSLLVFICVLKSKTEVQVKDDIKTCYFHECFTK